MYWCSTFLAVTLDVHVLFGCGDFFFESGGCHGSFTGKIYISVITQLELAPPVGGCCWLSRLLLGGRSREQPKFLSLATFPSARHFGQSRFPVGDALATSPFVIPQPSHVSRVMKTSPPRKPSTYRDISS